MGDIPVFTLGLSAITLIAMRFESANGIGLPLLLCGVRDSVAWFLGSRDTILVVLFPPINAITHDLMGFGLLDLLVRDARCLLLLLDFGGDVKAVVGAQIEEVDVLFGVYPCCLDAPEDGMLTTADGLVLVVPIVGQ